MSVISKKINYIVRSKLHPTLKSEGYIKSSRTFRRKLDKCTQIVNIQGSWANLGEEGQFTINLGVYFPEAEILLGLFPVKENPLTSDCIIQERIGFLTPTYKDIWWTVNSDSNLDEFSKEINDCWLKYGKEWLDKHSSIEEAVQFSLSKKNFFWASIFSLIQANEIKSKSYLEIALNESIKNPDLYSRLKDWGTRNGIINPQ